ncbi:trypsin-like peptidase domain-containing protein [Microvirga sp. HBU67558]|uniref:trypsin-like serine peptidase n=1 Tax=Microvirga TaxID=186650 RepID=UPI001B360103|nr:MULTISPECIES: trypsin-like serine protease [unclassified Microvirga]MBQ0821689.1 trypsin-like peptidase domain-containing protein [Microvirga sp. HBU67558]
MLALSKRHLTVIAFAYVAVFYAPAIPAQPSGNVQQPPLSSQTRPELLAAPLRKPSSLRPIREEVVSTDVTDAGTDGDVQAVSGQLYFSIGGNLHYCSGVFVTKSVILTAAHCVQENGKTNYYQIEKFVREGNNSHFIKKDASNKDCIRVPVEWSTQTDAYLRIDYDYAFLRVANSDELNADPKVILVDAHVGKNSIKAYGYPASANQDLTAIAENVNPDLLHPNLLAVDTTSLGFTEGTSGGPWVWKHNAGGTGNTGGGGQQLKIVSVNSSYAIPVNDKSKIWIYGPNFKRPQKSNTEPTAYDLRQNAENCQ